MSVCLLPLSLFFYFFCFFFWFVFWFLSLVSPLPACLLSLVSLLFLPLFLYITLTLSVSVSLPRYIVPFDPAPLPPRWSRELVGWQRVVWVPAPRCSWWIVRPTSSPYPAQRNRGGFEEAKSFSSCWWDWPCWDLLSRDFSSTNYTCKTRWGSLLHAIVCLSVCVSQWKREASVLGVHRNSFSREFPYFPLRPDHTH